MKKALAIILASAVLLSGCSAGTSEPPTEAPTATNEAVSGTEVSDITSAPDVTESTTAATIPATTVQTTTATTQPAEQTEPLPELPVMDGSTSAIPLEAGLKARLLDIPYDKALELVSHTKTHTSFQNLLDGAVDLIFTVPISEEQQAMADEAGVELVSVPVAKEGFVFVVNKDNPVDTLTQQQIRDIYSGRITNWKEVGGSDAEIIPYQRNADSGSQNYMVEFMGDTPLMEAKTELYAVGMGGLMDKIALYDNSVNAIGYSVYSYAAQMYANDNQVKFIAVDGVAPTKETMADDSYPLCSCTYIMHTDSADDKTREFTEWATSDEGQLCVLQSGYLPVNGMEIPAEYMPYSAVGTGMAKPSDYAPSEQYVAGTISSDFYGRRQGYYYIKGISDSELQERINEDLKQAQDCIDPYKPDWGDSEGQEFPSIDIQMYNGYLSILLYYFTPYANVEPMGGYSYGCYDRAVSIVYDLVEKKRITEFSDLFYEGEDFMPLLNNAFAEHAALYPLETDILQKSDFSGVLGDIEVFTLSSICLNEDNTYFHGMPLLSFAECDEIKDSMVIWQYREYDGISDFYIYDATEYVYENFEEDGVYYTRVKSSRFHTDEEIASYNEKLLKMEHEAAEHYVSIGFRPVARNFHYMEDYGIYAFSYERYAQSEMVYFDGETCEKLTPEVLLCENWRDYFSEDIRDAITYFGGITGYADGVYVYACVPRGENHYSYEYTVIPYEDLNPKYFSKWQ